MRSADAPQVTISVVTVVLNNKEGLESTARSVVAQRNAAYEWLVIDGGSTDGTLDVIDTYRNSIAYWQSQRDGGIYDAMNKGLQRATGDYVVFLNSGDYFAGEDSLSTVARSVGRSACRPAMILVGARYQYPFGHSVIQRPRRVPDYIHYSNPASHQATFFDRRLHQRVPYDTTYRIAGDYDGICRVFLEDQRCAYLDNILVVALRGGESFSHSHPIAHVRECIRIQRSVLHLGRGSIAVTSLRRLRSYAAEYLMSRRHFAQATWPIIRAARRTAD